MSYQKLLDFSKNEGIVLLENEPLSKHTSFRIGGPARLFALFGLCFIGMGVYSLCYHKRNAEADVQDRDSLLEIVDSRPEETAHVPSDASYCPWCGEKLGEDYQYCPKCGRKLS